MSKKRDTRFLTGNNKIFLEKAIQLYVFFRHVSPNEMPSDLAKRMKHDGNVVYSLITGYFEKNKFSIEYLEFLNDELRKLSKLDDSYFKNFTIMPTQIDELELQQKVSLSFTDDETGKTYTFQYEKESGKCEFEITS
ncbi:MAG TPA: hypothetical protein VKA34_03020 [Balneolales bacterium]|nr:hypothetical protein [Balneolales bacterium]